MSRVCLPACPHRSTSCVPIRSNASHTLHLFVVAGRNVESGTKRSGFRVSHSSHDSHRRIPHVCSIRSRSIVCRRRRAAAIVLLRSDAQPPPRNEETATDSYRQPPRDYVVVAMEFEMHFEGEQPRLSEEARYEASRVHRDQKQQQQQASQQSTLAASKQPAN